MKCSPGPWKRGSVGQQLGIKDSEKRAVAAFMPQHYPKNADLELMLAAPEMYQTLREICSEDWATRAEAFLAAKSIVARLEGD